MRFNSGFVPVPRHWWDHLETAPAAWSKVWIYVALNANIRPANFQGRVIQRGQLVRSVASLARECGVTSRQTRGALEGMREANVASIETTNKYSVITLLEFDVYGSSTESECQTEWKTKCQTPRQTDDKRDGNNLKNKQVKVKAAATRVRDGDAPPPPEYSTESAHVERGESLPIVAAPVTPKDSQSASPPMGPGGSESSEIGKYLQRAMADGTPPPDGKLVSRVHAAMQGATMEEFDDALLRYRRRGGGPPRSYGFWPEYLQYHLSPSVRANLGTIAEKVAVEESKPPSCSRCAGSGVVGGSCEDGTAGQVEAALRAGESLCECQNGAHWKKWFEPDNGEAGDHGGLPAVQVEPRQAVAR